MRIINRYYYCDSIWINTWLFISIMVVLMEYSIWHKRVTIPNNAGVYQVNELVNRNYAYQYWNGYYWGLICTDINQALSEANEKSLFQKPIWRSFTMPIKQLLIIQKSLLNQISDLVINPNNIDWKLVDELTRKLLDNSVSIGGIAFENAKD